MFDDKYHNRKSTQSVPQRFFLLFLGFFSLCIVKSPGKCVVHVCVCVCVCVCVSVCVCVCVCERDCLQFESRPSSCCFESVWMYDV
jgi:hypothetical protein